MSSRPMFPAEMKCRCGHGIGFHTPACVCGNCAGYEAQMGVIRDTMSIDWGDEPGRLTARRAFTALLVFLGRCSSIFRRCIAHRAWDDFHREHGPWITTVTCSGTGKDHLLRYSATTPAGYLECAYCGGLVREATAEEERA